MTIFVFMGLFFFFWFGQERDCKRFKGWFVPPVAENILNTEGDN